MACRNPAGYLAFVLLVSAVFLSPVSAQSPSLKVMAVGDSITEGFTGYAGWRFWLWEQLQNHGYTNIDFVGTQNGAFLGPPLYAGYDQDHEAFWGARADQIIDHLPGALARLRDDVPDIVLVHLGHNDVIQGQSIVSTAGEILALIERVREFNRDCTFIVAKVIPTGTAATNANLAVLNQLLGTYAPVATLPNSPVIIADQWTGFDPSTDLYDGVHPNHIGERKMSNVWLRAIGQAIGHFKLRMSFDPATNLVTATNLGGPVGAHYLSVVTLHTGNANGGLGHGWFGGLHIGDPELFEQAATNGAPFVGAFDAHGSSSGEWPADPALFPPGTVLYANTLAFDPLTFESLSYAVPTSISF